MKKWHLEGVLLPLASEKLVLPDPHRSAPFVSSPSSFSMECREAPWLCCCRRVVAFFIRCL